MTLFLLPEASLAINIHVICAIPALLLGPIALFRKRRDRLHKTVGYVWITAMVGLSVSGLFIESFMSFLGFFGPIHLLSIVTLAGLAAAIWQIRTGDVAGHRRRMCEVWFGAMGLAGTFTLVPGRIMSTRLLGEDNPLGWALIAAALLGLAYLAHYAIPTAPRRA
ncbi:MAG: DUF2306 domain-containing protein [Rhodobacteraceae bacterium]|nr:DUF2306 domain-containing protein [Paracoccaceae bacterium]